MRPIHKTAAQRFFRGASYQPITGSRSRSGTAKVPLWLKLLYTVFVCVLVPSYWVSCGPSNFLWFSDIALLAVLVALWLESPLVASTQAVSVVLLELVWVADFLVRLLTGVQLVGISAYMF